MKKTLHIQLRVSSHEDKPFCLTRRMTGINSHPWYPALSSSVKYCHHLLLPVCLHGCNTAGVWGQPSLKVNIAQAKLPPVSSHLFPMNPIDFFSDDYYSTCQSQILHHPESIRHIHHAPGTGEGRFITWDWKKDLCLSLSVSLLMLLWYSCSVNSI